MATRKNLQRAYGFGQGIYDLSPKPIVAQRAPTTRDFAEIGTIWCDQVAGIAYTLISVVANQATWGNQAQIGALVTDLTVNPGPFELLSNTNAAQIFLVDLNGGAAETAEIISQQGTGAATILLEATVGGVTINAGTDVLVNATGAIDLAADDASNFTVTGAGLDLTLESVGGSVIIEADEDVADAIQLLATAGGINIAATGAAGQDIQIINTGGSLTIRSTEADANAVVIQATGAGAAGIQISTDANVTAVNVGTGAAAKTVVVGSTNTTSTTTLQSGSGGVSITAGATGTVAISANAVANTVTLGTGAAAKTVTVGSTNTTSTTTVQSGTGGLIQTSTGAISATSSVAANNAAVLISASAADGGITLDAGVAPGVRITNGTQTAQLLVGTLDPNATVTGLSGSLYIRTGQAASPNTTLYVNTDAVSGTAWTPLTS